MKLFTLKIPHIEPALGIELFVLEAESVEDADPVQEALWGGVPGLEGTALSELIDRLKGRAGIRAIYRYLPDEQTCPERSIKETASIAEQPSSFWKSYRPTPT